MHILIVGASIAGLTAAVSLRKSGFKKVTVFERLAAPKEARRPRNGGGIGLHDNSLQILWDLGIQFDDYLPMQDQEERESLFLRKIFPGFLLEKSAKSYATANAFGCPDSSSSPRFDPTRGRNIGSK